MRSDPEKKLACLREEMEKRSIDVYIVCTEDFHGSEYVGDYFKTREYLSGFTGSAGTLLVLAGTMGQAAGTYLWTDGRYFLQAEKQLKGTGIVLMKDGQPGVPRISDFLAKTCLSVVSECPGASEQGRSVTIGFDGRCISADFVEQLQCRLEEMDVRFAFEEDLAGAVWQDRPPLSKEPVWELDVCYAGLSREEKLCCVRTEMEKQGTDYYVISALDDIAWLLNLRGNDVACSPVFLSYMLIGRAYAYLYVHEEILSEQLHEKLNRAGVMLRPYDAIYEDLRQRDFIRRISSSETTGSVLVDKRLLNYRLFHCISETFAMVETSDPVQTMKAVKTRTECEHIRQAHVKDGVAVTRFMYWLKSRIGKEEITEISAAKKLEDFRREQEGYLGPSFAPIMAFAEHGAVVHYSATEESNAVLEPRSFLLSDTGGHYLNGTTDITRTYALGPLSPEEKKAYTLVLAGHLALANARFPHGMRGVQLDILAREPLWREGLDFNHGTGHGVGYLLNVHEGPNAFRYRMPNERPGEKRRPVTSESYGSVLEEGMVTSDEPGLYISGQFGIRHENLLLCRKLEPETLAGKGDAVKNPTLAAPTEYGQFMGFEYLTMVPFDWDAIDLAYLSDRELEYLNAYHRQVYETLSPFLSGEEKEWLYAATKERSKAE